MVPLSDLKVMFAAVFAAVLVALNVAVTWWNGPASR
jgi:hypothetical protein